MPKVLLLLIIALMLACPAMATTETFTLTSSEAPTSHSQTVITSTAMSLTYPLEFRVNLSTIPNPTNYVYYCTPDSGDISTGSGNFVARLQGTDAIIGTGTVQTSTGTFVGPGGTYTYQFSLAFNSWTPGALTGVQRLNLTWDGTVPQNIAWSQSSGWPLSPTYAGIGGYATFPQWRMAQGDHIVVSGASCSADWVVTNQSVVSSTMVYNASVVKTSCESASKIFKGGGTGLSYTGALGSSDEDITGIGADLIFQSYFPATSTYINSSIYFLTSPTTPGGDTTTYFQAVDGQTNGAIHGANISIKDVGTGLWSNSTSDGDGTHYINTGTSTTLNGYADAEGYTSVSRTGLAPFDEGIYELIMWPSYIAAPPGSGEPGAPELGDVNLIIIVNDKLTQEAISEATINAILYDGQFIAGTTGAGGSATLIVPNQTIIRVTASKSNYQTGTKVINTSATGPDTIRIELEKLSAPTTPPTVQVTNAQGTVITTAPTLDSRTSQQKGEDAMGLLYDNGEGLVGICIIAIFLGAIKMMGKK